jgi:hypothetical protein
MRLAPNWFLIFYIIGAFKMFFKHYMSKIRVSPPRISISPQFFFFFLNLL